MRRVLLTTLVVLAAGGAAVFAGGAGEDSDGAPRYTVELDNAFGLIEGADVKVSGVRAGKIAAMRLDRESGSFRALIDVELNQEGFGDLRADTFCESRPQSLIGEYFLDCKPGDSDRKLQRGATIPVEQTGSTVPVDLVNNIMRRPFRERFSILLSELGAGLAARGPELNETIRRLSPALRETDRVLAILAEQRRTIRDLYDDADTVLTTLADDRDEVSRFVLEARDTAATSASRADGIRAQFARLPSFLRELRPTMRLLGEAADAQRPALASLQSNASLLRRFFDDLGPFATASRPAFRTLGDAAQTGRRAVRSGRPNIAELREGVDPLPEVADNLATTLEHLDNPDFAVEKDARAGRPGGGYTGLEALLRYIHNQGQAINLFDANGYMLKATAFLDNKCAPYRDAAAVKELGKNAERCRAWLGDHQIGINMPDPTATGGEAQTREHRDEPEEREEREEREAPAERPAEAPAAPEARPAPEREKGPLPGLPPSVQELLDNLLPDGDDLPRLDGLGDGLRDGLRSPGLRSPGQDRAVLDYLLGP